MRYGIIVDSKVTEPTDVPVQGSADPITWLIKHRFPGVWVRVSDDAVPGAVYNGNGSSTNPAEPQPQPQSKVKSQAEFESWAIERLGSVTAWQTLLEKCAAQPGSTAADIQTRYFPRWTAIPGSKTKAQFEVRCTPLTTVSPAIISPAALQTALDNW